MPVTLPNSTQIGSGISNIGTGAGTAINSVLGGIFGPVTGLFGQTTTSQTADAGAAEQAKKRTLTIVIAALAIVTVGAIAFVLIKKN